MIDQAIVIADKAGVIRIWSAAAESLLGYDAATIVGQTLDVIVPPEYREHHWRGFRAAMESDNRNIDRASVNVPVVGRDGTILRLAVRLFVLRDARERTLGAMAIFVSDNDLEPALPRL